MYIAFVTQKGEGCDYTIACGKDLWILNAETRDEAIAELRQYIFGDRYMDLKSIVLFKVSRSEPIPIDKWYEAEARRALQKLQVRAEARELKKYEELKAKYGD